MTRAANCVRSQRDPESQRYAHTWPPTAGFIVKYLSRIAEHPHNFTPLVFISFCSVYLQIGLLRYIFACLLYACCSRSVLLPLPISRNPIPPQVFCHVLKCVQATISLILCIRYCSCATFSTHLFLYKKNLKFKKKSINEITVTSINCLGCLNTPHSSDNDEDERDGCANDSIWRNI